MIFSVNNVHHNAHHALIMELLALAVQMGIFFMDLLVSVYKQLTVTKHLKLPVKYVIMDFIL